MKKSDDRLKPPRSNLLSSLFRRKAGGDLDRFFD
jgi:hypothetical protein